MKKFAKLWYRESRGLWPVTLRAVQRAMRWAARKGYMDRSPVADYEKARPGKRNVMISPLEWMSDRRPLRVLH